MEAVNKMATEAARAVWGNTSHGKEPISGAQGHVPRDEPFDAGNLSAVAQQERLDKVVENPSASHPASTRHGRPDEDTSPPNYRHDSGMMLPGEKGEKQLDKTIEALSHKASHSSTREPGLAVAATPTDQTPRSAENGPVGDHQAVASSGLPRDIEKDTPVGLGPSRDHPPRDAERQTSVGHGDGSADAPSSDEPSEYAHTNASSEEEGTKKDRETSVMGAGPKSLADVAKNSGGDAGNNGDAAKETSDSTAEREDGKEDGQESKGTGEKYVRTTGLAADGGDFDATKPGAGREADRLMEEKGKSRESLGNNDGKLSGGGDGDKPSLGERIKNKLHNH
ncbi:glycine-rich cell wall structural protein 1 [Ophiocordyceps sinensis CO18]|uniref:Glycine-rich cell wall structural protein 1 n=1 Tax=Ophiocordyceps sinensis (strain Co18 / CGMCC 3.14243) TaxID=911162 RepID=T5A6S1_OPHSC|nr:glycine-rich cell wall structural protein 1 [Ophiocordyceps sinensis CO18]